MAGAGEREVKVKSSSSSGFGAGCGCSLGCAAVPRGRSSCTLLPHRRTCPRRSAPQPGPHRRRPPRTALCGPASPWAQEAGRWQNGAVRRSRPRAGLPSTSHTAKHVSNARIFFSFLFLSFLFFSFWPLFETFPPPPRLPSPSLPSVSWNFLRRFSSSPTLSPGFSSFINALSLLRSHRRQRNSHPPGAGLRPLSEPPEKLREARERALRRLR